MGHVQGRQGRLGQHVVQLLVRRPDLLQRVHVGLARGFSGVGDYKAALKHAEIALTQAPDDINKKSLEAAVVRLKEGKDMNTNR